MPTKRTIIARGGDIRIKARSAKQPPKFTAEIYTGIQLNINGYDLPVVIDLAGLSLGNVLVANLDHNSTQRVASGFTVKNDGRKLVATGELNAVTPHRAEVVKSAKKGYRWQASVEVNPSKIETVKPGEQVQANGRTFKGPLYITRRGVLKGFAFVSHGADDNTSVSVAAKQLRPLAALVRDMPLGIRVASIGCATLLTMEEFFHIDGDKIRAAITDAEIEPEFTHGGVPYFSITATIQTLLESAE